MKPLGIAIALFLFLVHSKADESFRKVIRDHNTKELNKSWPAIVADWKPVSIVAVDMPKYAFGKPAGISGQTTVPLLGKVSLSSESQKLLQDLLVSEAVPHDGTRTGCFLPRHAIVFEKGDSAFTLVICFQCNEIEILGVAPKGDWQHALMSFSDELRGYLNGHLDAGGVKRDHKKKTGEQGGARQPATAPESKPEGSERPKPESEGRSQ